MTRFSLVIVFIVLALTVSGQGKANKSGSASLPDHQKYSKLKAVLVVGPCETSTSGYILQAKEIGKYLRSKGVQVTELYDPKATWKEVTKACNGANILFYSGHGSTLGPNGSAGGLCLTKGLVSTESVSKEIKLHKDALVLFQSVCGGAGSSASDDSDIGTKVAFERVRDYARPFIEMGAGGYYADNFYGSTLKFIKKFFAGESVQTIYTAAATGFSKPEAIADYEYAKGFKMSVASNYTPGTATRTSIRNGVSKTEEVPSIRSYDIAFVADPEFTVKRLLQ